MRRGATTADRGTVHAAIPKALDAVLAMEQEAERVSVPGNREYNPGWHTALDLRNLLTIS